MLLSRILLARVDTREVNFVHDSGWAHGVDRVKRSRELDACGLNLCNRSSEAKRYVKLLLYQYKLHSMSQLPFHSRCLRGLSNRYFASLSVSFSNFFLLKINLQF